MPTATRSRPLRRSCRAASRGRAPTTPAKDPPVLRPITTPITTVIGADATSVTIALLDPDTPGLSERGCCSAEEEGEDDGADVDVAGAVVDGCHADGEGRVWSCRREE